MKGSYILLLKVNKSVNVKVGSLGVIKFKRGIYAYVGSAMNGIEARVRRHIKLNREKSGRLKWHIDYLLVNDHVRIVKVFFIPTRKRSECIVSKLLERKAIETVRKFGSTDCKTCKGHLHYLGKDKI